LHQEREQADQLAHEVQERDSRISELEQEQQFANDNIARLEQNLQQRDEEIAQYTRRVVERESEVEQLREEMSKLKREHSHLLSEQTRALQDVTGQQDQTKARMDELIRAKAEADVELKTSRDRVTVLKEEVERLRRQIHSLQQESADKEVKIVQMTKQHSLDKEDIQGLNIALDSKQQELELVCFSIASFSYLFKCLLFLFFVRSNEKWAFVALLEAHLLNLPRLSIEETRRCSVQPLSRALDHPLSSRIPAPML
jgi:chromosome segregation ATPase